VFPGEYGIPKPPHFFLMPSYWLGWPAKKQKLNDVEVNKCYHLWEMILVVPQMNQLDTNVNQSVHEQEPLDLKCGISIRGLKKKFKVE